MNFEELKNKRVFLTGHTGFKGAWLCKILQKYGAIVTGFSLEPSNDNLYNKNLFSLSNVESKINSIIGDVRNFEELKKAYDSVNPEIIIHLAAQPIVLEGYKNPRTTYETNVMGTINLLECVRLAKTPPKSVLNVTTDKVYLNKEQELGYCETDEINGFDPYSNSKSCSELVTSSYNNSFFAKKNTCENKIENKNAQIPVSTARAGNVIGGGDYANNRIVPDCVFASLNNEKIILRNPNSIRPFQHVLDSLFAYLLIAVKQLENASFAGSYNVGPLECDCITTKNLVEIFCKKWGKKASYEVFENKNQPHEASFLKLDCTKMKNTFNWKPVWNIETAIEKTVEFSKLSDEEIVNCMEMQISEFSKEFSKAFE